MTETQAPSDVPGMKTRSGSACTVEMSGDMSSLLSKTNMNHSESSIFQKGLSDFSLKCKLKSASNILEIKMICLLNIIHMFELTQEQQAGYS